MKTKKHINILIIILLFLFLIVETSCRNKEIIKIGLLCDLTGRSSSLGISARNAIEIAVDEYNNSSKNNKIQLVIKDDKGLPQKVPKILKEYVDEDVKLIIGPLTSNIGLKIFNLENQEKNDFLFISPTISSSKLSGLDDNFITLIDINEEQGVLLAKEAIKKGINKIATIYEYDNKSYTEPIAKVFEDTFISLGGEVAYSNYFVTSENAPFKYLAENIIDSKAEGVLIAAGAIDSSQLIQYINKIDPDIFAFCGMWAKTNDFIANGGKAVEGSFLVGINNDISSNSEFKKFDKEYLSRYDIEPSFSSICTYEAIKILLDAIEKNNSTDPKVIKESIINKKTFKGLAESYNIDSNGNSNRPYVLFQVEKGKFKMVRK